MERRRSLTFVMFVFAPLFAAACGGGSSDWCHFGSKVSNCSGATASSCSSSDIAACETAIATCSSADQATLNDYANCIANQGGCGSANDWVKIEEHCLSQITALDSASGCLETINKAAPSCGG